MAQNHGAFLKLLTSKLSRRIVFWVFVSVIVIETIILIPSLIRRQAELLSQMEMVTEAKLALLLQEMPREITPESMWIRVQRLKMHPSVLGGTLYDHRGNKVGMFGEAPQLAFQRSSRPYRDASSQNGRQRFDVAWPPAYMQRDYTLVLRHDASPVRKELYAFTMRIGILVLIISIFVTGGAWAALRPIVVKPILKLRRDLLRVGESVSKDDVVPIFDSAEMRRPDELGEVITAFTQMHQQIFANISERKRAEMALKQSLDQVEAYSKALNNELEKGREIQQNFLPENVPDIPGWEFAAYFKPARQVAGDFYDIFELPDEQVGLVVADVCDKGVGAALFMALFRSLIRIFSNTALICIPTAVAQANANPGNQDQQTMELAKTSSSYLQAVQLANNYIARNHGDLAMFATLFYGVLRVSDGRLSYINAGHEPLYVVSHDGTIKSTLKPTGPAVGIQPEKHFEMAHCHITAGDILFGYTDGVPEATSEEGNFFSTKRMLNLLSGSNSSASDLIQRIAGEVSAHTGSAEQFDDITMLAVHNTSSPSDPNPWDAAFRR